MDSRLSKFNDAPCEDASRQNERHTNCKVVPELGRSSISSAISRSRHSWAEGTQIWGGNSDPDE